MRKLLILLTCGLIVSVGCRSGPPADSQVLPTFQAVTMTLNDVASVPAGMVPDAVLNRTRCMVVIPGREKTRISPGAATCRNGSGKWDEPSLVSYQAPVPQSGDVLLFILDDRAAATLKSGTLELKHTVREGPAAEKIVTAVKEAS